MLLRYVNAEASDKVQRAYGAFGGLSRF